MLPRKHPHSRDAGHGHSKAGLGLEAVVAPRDFVLSDGVARSLRGTQQTNLTHCAGSDVQYAALLILITIPDRVDGCSRAISITDSCHTPSHMHYRRLHRTHF